jgi:hypothetical protein
LARWSAWNREAGVRSKITHRSTSRSTGWPGWDGPQWAEFFEGAEGRPATTLWLGHRRPTGRDDLSVGTTTSRHPTDEITDLAFAAAFTLTERMRPDRAGVEFPPDFNTLQFDHAVEVANAWATWPSTPCEVDGQERTLRFWRYAGGWAGFIAELSEVDALLVGAGVDPAGLRLETVRDPARYGFDPSARLSLSQLEEARRRRPEASLPLPWSTSMHADHLALVARQQLG